MTSVEKKNKEFCYCIYSAKKNPKKPNRPPKISRFSKTDDTGMLWAFYVFQDRHN